MSPVPTFALVGDVHLALTVLGPSTEAQVLRALQASSACDVPPSRLRVRRALRLLVARQEVLVDSARVYRLRAGVEPAP